MNCRQSILGHVGFSLVVINNFNIKGVAILKAEAYAPLFVNTDTPLPCAIMNQRFQPVGRRKEQILNARGPI